jgi:hypothetical protein
VQVPYIVNSMLSKMSAYKKFDQFLWHVSLCVFRRQAPFLVGLHEYTSACQNFADVTGAFWKECKTKTATSISASWRAWDSETRTLVAYNGITNMSHILRKSYRGNPAFRGLDIDAVDSICERVESEISLLFGMVEQATCATKKRDIIFHETRRMHQE